MPIIGQVGRRALRVRLLNIGIHVALILGSITMVYPLMIMLSGSVKSPVDSRKLSVLPRYFYDENTLFKKWIETKYNEDLREYNDCYREPAYSFDSVAPPHRPVAQRNRDWMEFLDGAREELTEFFFSLGNARGTGIKPELSRMFIRELKNEPDVRGDIEALNRKYGTAFVAWDAVELPVFKMLRRDETGSFNSFNQRAIAFTKAQDRGHFIIYSLDSYFVKWAVRARYGQDIRKMNEALGTDFRSWSEVTLSRLPATGPLRELAAPFVKNRLNRQFIRVSPAGRADYQNFLRERYGNIATLNQRYGTDFAGFNEVELFQEIPRIGDPIADWDYFISDVIRPEHLIIRSAEFMYRDSLKSKYGAIEELVQAHALGLHDFAEMALAERLPMDNLSQRGDWLEFLETIGDRDWTCPDFAARKAYTEFLTEPHRQGNRIDWDSLNSELGTEFHTEDDIFVPTQPPNNPRLRERWKRFLAEVCPKDLILVDVKRAGSEWLDFLRAKYGTIRELNARYGLIPADFDQVQMPVGDVDYFAFQRIKRHLFREFLVRNYAAVFELMLYSGRAIVNTVIYCALSVLAALIVNPLAAYALSRYKPPSQYKLLLFLMLTMAFPPIVLGIPNFILLRKLHLLNTFAALILPAAASGYSIFLLKGFFDSLPRELYESAQIDGASEWTMFWRITMATSKPILAVVALWAFLAAYGNFMFAFIVCQDPKMWTIMVQMYQLQQRASQGVSFAAVVVAAIPTLLVFLFCQNIIMRGIVVPTEK